VSCEGRDEDEDELELAGHKDRHKDDEDESFSGVVVDVVVSAFGGLGALGPVDVVVLLLLPPPNSCCICAMNLATSGSSYVDSDSGAEAVDGAGLFSVLLLLLPLLLASGVLPFGADPDDHIQPILLLMVS
jgi:hypothetical protein